MTALWLLLVAAVCAAAPPRLFNAGYLGSGLNLLSADVNVFDPAQFGAPVYNLSWTQGLTTEDGRWSIPDNSYARGYPACEFDASTTKITNTYDYQNWLSYSVSSHSSFFDLFSGSSSSSYSQYNEFTYSSMKYVYMAHALCSTYQLAYRPFINQTLSDDFIQGVSKLPPHFDITTLGVYFEFISYFGTHVIKSLNMGGRMVMNIFVNAEDFLVMESQQIDCSAEAGISFIVDAGVDAHGEDKTQTHITFSKYAEQEALKCMGGDPGNCSFANWAPSVPTNPVPVGYDLDDLASLLTSDFFPADPNIAQRQQSLRAATRMFFQTNGTAPESYCADASNTANIPNHYTTIFHGAGVVPSFVQLQNTQIVDRTYSQFYPMEWAYAPGNTNNFLTVRANEQHVDLALINNYGLGGSFDGATGQWISSNTAYWTSAVMSRAPDVGGHWVPVTSTGANQQVVLAQNLSAGNITLFQVQFAETQQPTVVYPLVYRWGGQPSNPASITVVDNEVTLEFNTNNGVFWRYEPSTGGWVVFASGFFRVNIFNIKPDFDSGWRQSPVGAATMFSVPHGLDTVPQIVQVFFSPDMGTRVFPVLWNYNAQSTPNPVSVAVDRHVVSLSLTTSPPLFRSFNAELGNWLSFNEGSWRFTCFISPALLAD